nr:ATP synthase 6 [Physella acuta]CAH2593500.1 ATP synthase 6 [Physella acuta]CAH2594160.1 ATP synthase 6 [Physella acuta]
MFTDLFSSLDGCISFYIWMTPLLVCIFLSTKSHLYSMNSALSLYSNNVIKTKSGLPGALIFFIAFINLLGLTPFTYGLSSSLWFSSGLALSLWGYLILSGISLNPKKFFAHFLPSGTPTILTPFLILIETISVLIRPLTLTVRLIANISAGHIVLALVANCLSSCSTSFSSSILLMLSIAYNFFEVFVCLIQAYIFTLLITLYSNEHP